MELGPILRAMARKKIGVGLLVAEIAVTMAIVLNCLNMVIDNRERMMIPSGLDEENIISISMQSYGDSFQEVEFGDQVREQDLALIRSQPGVIDATPTVEPVEHPPGAFAAGTRVFHQKFGYGRVIAVDGNKLRIAFEKAGEKKVMDSFVEPAEAR